MAKMTKATLVACVEDYLDIQAQIKVLEKQADDLKKALKAEAEKTESGTIVLGAHSITLTECTRNSIDVKEFTADHPKLAERYTKTTTYTMLKVK